MGKITLTEEDLGLINTLKEERVLQGVENHRLAGNHTVVICCPDCHQIDDIFEFHKIVCGGFAPHPIALNGGALLIPSRSPLQGARVRRKIIVEDTIEAVKMKGIERIVLYAHAPCGKAYAAGLNILGVIGLLCEAKMVLKRRFRLSHPGLKFFCFCHICYCPREKRRTYFVSRAEWERFQTNQPPL